jgi:hypothetical protein
VIRVSHTLALTSMLLRFFRRRVLNAGVLRSPLVKGVVGALAVGLLGACSVAAYLFLEPVTGEAWVWRVLLDNATISLVLWVQVAFLFVKVLFLNAEGLLELSFQLPLTNRERSAALLAYEVVMTGVVVAVGSLSLTVATLVLLGPAGVPPLLVSIVIPVVLTYLGLSVLHLALTRLFALLRLRAVQNVALVLTLFTLLVLYARSMSGLVTTVSRGYLDGRDPVLWVTAVAWAARHHGFLPTAAAATLLAAALTVLVVALTPSQHVRHSRFLAVPVGAGLRRVLGPYDWCLLRNSQTVLSVALAVMLFVYLSVTPLADPLWSLALLSFSGLYQFAATQPLRMIPGAATSPWRTYGRLLRAQLLLVALFSVPAVGFLAVRGSTTVAGSLTAVLGCVVGVTLALCIGIVFPAERDNPFSIFIGLSVSVVVVALAAIGLGVLQLPPAGLLGALVVASAACVGISVRAIGTSDSRRRHEHTTPQHPTPRPADAPRDRAAAARAGGRRAADRLDRRRGPAVPDVSHG